MAWRKLARDHVELFLSIAALVTAVAAVFIALEQTKVMREEASLERERQKIAVMPSVWVSTFINTADGSGEYKLVFANRGLGPAVIERFDISVNGRVAKNWDQLTRILVQEFGDDIALDGRVVRSARSPISAGMFLEAGHDTSPFSFTSDGQKDLFKLFAGNTQRMDLSLCYCALYGSCYVAKLFRRPVEIEQCEADPQPFVSHAFFPE
ncbi:hypothetical protein [Planctobacterium marinum]|uniref:Uncharacterized protein n=1 Tax=Planctobacterium marinum TaxID=1631968 RepID=A0AA48KT95_9ALTE|nr:hypothetical protein MACH26_34880 [Planctobacterium marinum]